jgi:hypothetical protein
LPGPFSFCPAAATAEGRTVTVKRCDRPALDRAVCSEARFGHSGAKKEHDKKTEHDKKGKS